MVKFSTQQEEFWAGDFGTNYISRNNNEMMTASSLAMFAKIIERTTGIESVIEFGSNIGINLTALRKLLPGAELSAIEINSDAAEILKKNTAIKKVYEGSIFDFRPDYKRDFVFTRGVMIHLNPDMLDLTYQLLYDTSSKYICIAEYYNPTPVTINYRGYEDKLFKRDFAGEMMKKYDDLKLVDYGFYYHGDNNYPQDDITWFLLKK